MKICIKCDIEKDNSQFSKSKRTSDGLFSWCKSCRKEYDINRYEKIGSDQWTKLRKKRRKEISNWFAEYKRTLKCKKCPETHPACLDFHHKNGSTKENTVSNLVTTGSSKETILNEIKKCDVLCANCHRKHHYKFASVV